MKVSIETNETKIVVEDAFESIDASKRHEHNEKLVSLAYDYIKKKELMCQYNNGKLEKIKEANDD